MPPKKEERKPLEPIFVVTDIYYQYIEYTLEQVEQINQFLLYFKPELTLTNNIFDNMQLLCQSIGVHIHPTFIKPKQLIDLDDFDENQKFRNPEDGEIDNLEPQIVQFTSVKIDVCTIKLFDYCCAASGITTLKLCNNALSGIMQQHLATLITNPENRIKRLFLDWNTGLTVDFLKAIAGSINLEFLTLRSCKLNEMQIEAICGSVKTLKCIDLYDNGLSKLSMGIIGRMLKQNASMEFLGLAKNGINSFDDIIEITQNIGKFLLSPEELEEYRNKERDRDAIIERNKKVKKKGTEEVVPVLEPIQQIDNNFYIIRNSRLWLINLAMNNLEDGSRENIEKFLMQTGENFQLVVSGNKFDDQKAMQRTKKKFGKKLLVTNISQIETTIHVSSKNIGQLKLPSLYTEQRVQSTKRFTDYICLDDTQLKQLKRAQEQKDELIRLIAEKCTEEAIILMRQVAQECISKYDIGIFGKAIRLLGDLCISGREFTNALFCFNILRVLSDFQDNLKVKIEALIQMADLCKLLQDYNNSKLMLKKALQYVWYVGDSETECQIYDMLGMLYFLKGEANKAKEYHDRAVNFIKESMDSASRQLAIETVRLHQKRCVYKSNTVNAIVQQKLGIIQENDPDVKLTSTLEFHHQLDFFLQDDEFEIEMSTPNRPVSKLTMNGVLVNDVHAFKEVKQLHQRQAKLRYFDMKIPEMHLSRSVFKMTIEQQLEQRVLKDKGLSIEKFKQRLKKFAANKNFNCKLERVNINHLSPNRNMVGFKYTYKPTRKQIMQLFTDIEQYIYDDQ